MSNVKEGSPTPGIAKIAKKVLKPVSIAANDNIAARSAVKEKSEGSASDTAAPKESKLKSGTQKLKDKVQETKLTTESGSVSKLKKLSKAEARLEKTTAKLEKARSNLPSKKKLRKIYYTKEKTGKKNQKLKFEKTPISKGEHIKGALPVRPIKAAGNALIINAHRKIYQVENENVGVKAAHRLQMGAEAGVRSALRFNKTAPYREVAKLEKAVAKKQVKLAYQKTLAQNPKLKSNLLGRVMQKRKIKKQYAKAAREAKKAAKTAKKAGSTAAKGVKAIARAVTSHPVVTVVAILALLLLLIILPMFGSCTGIGNGITSTLAATTYLAADEDMYAAEEAYAAMEAELQDMLDNYETLHPDYDEYIFELDEIWHDPYVLISIISALHEGAWTIDEVLGTLEMLFEKQYILTETVTTQVRYRQVTTTVIDPVTGNTTIVITYEPYDYYICTVTLENFNLSHVPVYIMSEAKLSRYAMYMATLGNRPDLFPTEQFPHASTPKEYLKYDIPQEYLDADPIFAAMIQEANKYLGMPYVWGGSNPSTSFDCSGFVSWVLNQTGWNIGRLGARGLHSYSTPVSPNNARPGDLVFFHNTYNAPDPNAATHVGIYVGDGMMIHAGDPISYVSIESKYYREHFLAFGRIY